VTVFVVVTVFRHWLRPHEAEPEVSVRASVVMAMNAATVAMRNGECHDMKRIGARFAQVRSA
jgi:hypothetical protein